MAEFKYSPLDFLFTCVGLPLFLVDIVLDVWAAVSFFQDGAYAFLGVLVVCLVGSSLLVQAYSWLWYSYEEFKTNTKVENCLTKGRIKLLHFLQLGIYLRHAAVFETSLTSLLAKRRGDWAVYLSHDLSMLRIIETFAESSPQLVLMLTIMMQEGRLDPVTVLKASGSFCAITFCVTTYHRSLRSFLPDKKQQHVSSSVIYFLWNLILIVSRLTALALFASVLPCFIFTHFLCWWLVLFFCAWRSKTEFMDSSGGEWLFRATVGLIWYFNWFNVAEGETWSRTLLYHGYILADISFLCGMWFWWMSTDPPHFVIPRFYAMITACSVFALYILGLLLKMLYYKCYHPKLNKEELKVEDTESVEPNFVRVPDETDFPRPKCDEPETPGRFMAAARYDIEMRSLEEDLYDQSEDETYQNYQPEEGPDEVINRSQPTPAARCNKRMRKLAENFYA